MLCQVVYYCYTYKIYTSVIPTLVLRSTPTADSIERVLFAVANNLSPAICHLALVKPKVRLFTFCSAVPLPIKVLASDFAHHSILISFKTMSEEEKGMRMLFFPQVTPKGQ